MNKSQYMRATALLLAAFFFSGLPSPGQAQAETVDIALKTTPVNDFASPPPPVAPEIKPGFKEKSFSLIDAENFREMLDLTGPLSQEKLKFLEKNRFILLPAPREEQRPEPTSAGNDEMLFRFDQLGGDFREQKRVPQNARFIGPDIFLHAFHLYINLRQEAVETVRLRPAMRFMLEELLASAQALKKETSGLSRDKWERLTAQMVVPLILITNGGEDGSDTLDSAKAIFQRHRAGFSEATDKKITAELERIYRAEARVPGLLGLIPVDGGELIDYTRFNPRGHYRQTTAGRAYFRTMVWLSKLGWNLGDQEGLADALNCMLALSYDVSPSAAGRPKAAPAGGAADPVIKMAEAKPASPTAVANPTDAWQAWAMIMEINNFFLGYQSAPGFQQWIPFLMKEAEVDRFTADTAADAAVLHRLSAASASLAKSAPVAHESRPDGPGPVLCFFPPRDSLTKFMAAELTRPDIREGTPAVFSALYLPALMGSRYPRELLARQVALDFTGGETPPAESAEAVKEKARRSAMILIKLMDSWSLKLNERPDQRRFSSIDSAWMHLSGTLTRDYGSGYPLYMQTTAYQAKQLETVLGSNAERLSDLLFDQPAAEVPAENKPAANKAEDGPAAPVVKGFVEPNLAFWREMTRIAKYTADGFQSHGLFPEDLEEYGALSRFLKRLERCAALSEKELTGQPLTDDDYEFIRLFSLDFMAAPVGHGPTPDRRAALVTEIWTVAAPPEGQSAVVYEANAGPQLMLVLVGNDKTPRLTVGLAYNHYEITAPAGRRMTNERWRELVYSDANGPAVHKPPLPSKNFWYDPLNP